MQDNEGSPPIDQQLPPQEASPPMPDVVKVSTVAPEATNTEQTNSPNTGEPFTQDDWMPEGGTRNVEKAEVMAHEVDKVRDRDIAEGRDPADRVNDYDDISAYAGDRYELGEIAKREGKTVEQVEAEFFSREIMRNQAELSTIIGYGKSIIENQRKFGEKLTQGQEAFLAICEFVDKIKNGDEIVSGEVNKEDNKYYVTRAWSRNGDVPSGSISFAVKDGLETGEWWTVSPLSNSFEEDTYTVRTSTIDDDEFSHIETKKYRRMTQADVDRMKTLISEFVPRDSKTLAATQ